MKETSVALTPSRRGRRASAPHRPPRPTSPLYLPLALLLVIASPPRAAAASYGSGPPRPARRPPSPRPPPPPPPPSSRRDVLSRWGRCSASAALALLTAPGSAVAAARPPAGATAEDDVRVLSDGADALSSLLDNWERATVDCTYADVPRELLEAKNKELLLEKASTFALFDKSVSVVSCKTTNRVVRDYIGATGKGPLAGAEKRMLRRAVAERVDPDDLDDYYAEADAFSRAISRASSLSYAAGMADFDSVNNFEKGRQSSGGDTNLEQARKAIAEAKASLDVVVRLLRKGVGE